MAKNSRGVLVTGGGTFLGDNIAAALLAEGASVSLLVRPGAEDNLGPLAQTTRWSTADVWSPASLRGKSRFHAVVIHTVGSLKADPSRGLTYDWLNTISARNVADMCVRDGVERMILLSSVYAPWLSGSYVRSKRQAEDYLRRLGLRATVIRAPLVYRPGSERPLFYRLVTLLGMAPPLSWLYFSRVAPMRIDKLARGVALCALSEHGHKDTLFAGDLRRLIKRTAIEVSGSGAASRRMRGLAAPDETENMEEDMPFGWSPDDAPR